MGHRKNSTFEKNRIYLGVCSQNGKIDDNDPNDIGELLMHLDHGCLHKDTREEELREVDEYKQGRRDWSKPFKLPS